MKTSSALMKSQFHLTRIITNPSFLIIPTKTTSYLKHLPSQSARVSIKISSTTTTRQTPRTRDINRPLNVLESKGDIFQVLPDGCARFVVLGAVSLGFVLLFMGLDDQKAMALGPEGPLVEEFWENVRRYGLYALTVSTGALYTIFQPIFELLKNPISAVLLLVIFGGGIFIVSQVLSAMVGVTDFSYDYQY